jgi:hypothetical protein
VCGGGGAPKQAAAAALPMMMQLLDNQTTQPGLLARSAVTAALTALTTAGAAYCMYSMLQRTADDVTELPPPVTASSSELDLKEASRIFGQQGWVVIRGLFTQQELARVEAGYEQLLQKAQVALQAAKGQFKVIQRKNRAPEYLVTHDGIRYHFNLAPGTNFQDACASPTLDHFHLMLAAHVGCGVPDLEAIGGGGDSAKLIALATSLMKRDALESNLRSGEKPQLTQIIQQAHFKPPQSACEFKWHQDSQFRGFHFGHFKDVNGRGSYCNIAIAIDGEFNGGESGSNRGEHNGPLGVVPGVHDGVCWG